MTARSELTSIGGTKASWSFRVAGESDEISNTANPASVRSHASEQAKNETANDCHFANACPERENFFFDVSGV
jgi:hypothetical protein